MRKHSRFEDLRRRVPTSLYDDASVLDDTTCCDTVVLSPDDSVLIHPHRLEQDVRNRLMAEPSLNFTSLVVRRVPDGLCLEGVLETDEDSTDVARRVRRLCGVSQVLNHLVVHRNRELPLKG